MDECITYNKELIRLIDGIPVPDITVSELSQNSNHLCYSTKNNNNQQHNIVKRLQSQQKSQNGQLLKQKIVTLSSFESPQQDRLHKKLSYGNLPQQNESQKIIYEQMKQIIQDQTIQIAQMNTKIQLLENQINNYNQQKENDLKTISQLQSINCQQQEIINTLNMDIQIIKCINNKQQNQEQNQINIITELKTRIQILELQLNKNKISLCSTKNETLQSEMPSIILNPEILSEDETLSILTILLNRVSKSQRMIKLIQKNIDFKLLVKNQIKQSNNKISFVHQYEKTDCKMIQNNECFKRSVNNFGVKNL